ncbi:cupin domain-containing protein [Massiliimalia massiliensis]|uniref:cupin domain-containing protein n=1 Tax=Massiliimalia massiliensis TaxID=1852384 RepID=UPI001967F4A0|nr:cupin domain-containing protein [Massiliimalia massiliensis]
MEQMIKNMPHAEVLALAEQTTYLEGQIVSKTLAQNKHHSLTLFAFDKGEEISTHDSEGDAMVLCLEGEGRITVDGKDHTLKAGEAIVMPAKIPHAVYAAERFKMLLTVLFSDNR